MRKLHAGHFAFMRSVVQGVDARSSWERYLRAEGDATDWRHVRATISWIRDEFAVAARREARFGTARLVLMDASRLDDTSTPRTPSLEDFVLERGLEDFSQREQLEAFEEAHGRATQRESRRARLIRHQLEALRWLETRVAQPPRATDDVEAWFPPALAERLARGGASTLAGLVERVNALGSRWHSGLRGVGVVKAQRVVAWLTDHAKSIGVAPGDHARKPRGSWDARTRDAVAATSSAIRPFERLVVPAALDGSKGAYRLPAERCLIAARNDHQAIAAWLASKAPDAAAPALQVAGRAAAPLGGVDDDSSKTTSGSSALTHTQRAYRKEAERFLLWALVERGRALSSMTQEDCLAYRQFLADPQPRARWCGRRNRERWSPLWRPFEGSLSASAQAHAVRVLGNLWAFLCDMNYLSGNPWRGVSIPRSTTPRVNPGRSLTRAQWEFISERLDAWQLDAWQLGGESGGAGEVGSDSKALGDGLGEGLCDGLGDGRSGSRAEACAESGARARLRIAVRLLYATGLRASEIVAARVGDLVCVEASAARDAEADVEADVEAPGRHRVAIDSGAEPLSRVGTLAVKPARPATPSPDGATHAASEPSEHRPSTLVPHGRRPAARWILNVKGKGGRLREVPVPSQLVGELCEYLRHRGVPASDRGAGSGGARSSREVDPCSFSPDAFLLGRVVELPVRARGLAQRHARGLAGHPSALALAGISASTLYDQLKAFFNRCVDHLSASGDLAGATRLRSASTHWLRHTHASHSLRDGVRLPLVQQNLGHASLATTSVYVTAERDERMEAIEQWYERQ